MNKLASQIPGILHASAEHLTKLAEDNAALIDENAALRHELRVIKLAQRMSERGLDPSLSLDDKVDSLRGFGDEKLASLESAVELVAGGFSFGHISRTDETVGTVKKAGQLYPYSEGEDPCDNFVLSGSAYT